MRFAALLSKNTEAWDVEAAGTRMVYWFRSQAQEPWSSFAAAAMVGGGCGGCANGLVVFGLEED